MVTKNKETFYAKMKHRNGDHSLSPNFTNMRDLNEYLKKIVKNQLITDYIKYIKSVSPQGEVRVDTTS